MPEYFTSTKNNSSILGIPYHTNVELNGGDVILYLGENRVAVMKSDFEALEKKVKELQEKVQRLEQQAQQVQKS